MKKIGIIGIVTGVLLLTACGGIVKPTSPGKPQKPVPQVPSVKNNPGQSTEPNTKDNTDIQPDTGTSAQPPAPQVPPAQNTPGQSTEPNTQTDPAVIAEAFPEQVLVEKVEILASDSTPLPQDANGNYMLNLFVGSEYQIKAKILPEDAQDKSLTYEVETYKDCITISDTGFLTVVKKPGLNNKPYIRIEGSNGKFAQVKVEVTNDVDSIIKEFKLEGTHTVIEGKKNSINITDGAESTSTLTIKKGTKYSTYQYSISNSDMVEVIKTAETDTVDTYTLTVKENKSAWTKEALISFYTTQDSKKIPLREIKIVQDKNPNMKKRTEWVHGITPPPADKLYAEPFKYDTWGEDAGTDWFYARKRSYTGEGGFPDSQLCWAMTTANMLHWWFTQNEANIKKYMAKKGIQPGDDVYDFYTNKYDKNALEKDKSSFANKMREYAKNSGSLTQIGLQWYLEGRDSEYFKSKAPKLFSDVFSSVGDNSIATRAYLNNKNDLNKMFKEAIKNKEAIAVSYESNDYPAGHVVTVWGISLDGEENVIELWVADSDLAPHIAKPIVYNMGIEYDKNGVPMWYNTSGGQVSSKRFSLITRLGLGEDKFSVF